MINSKLELKNDFKRAVDLYDKIYVVIQSAESYEYLFTHMERCKTNDRLVLQERSKEDHDRTLEEFAREINQIITDYVMNDGEES